MGTEPKPAMTSKTVLGNSALFAAYTIAKWVNPEFSIPEPVLVSFLTLGNLLLRLVTKGPVG